MVTDGELQVGAIGNVVLMTLSGVVGTRLQEPLGRVQRSDRSVVLDLSAVDDLGDAALDTLRAAWRALGSRLRVVAPPGSDACDRLRESGLRRRFAVHSTLSDALAQAGA